MKKDKYAEKFLEELKRVPLVSSVCEKIGVSRNTIYEWRKKDQSFKKRMDTALDAGIQSVNDLAESQLIKKIQQGELRAVEFWLRNNKKNYMQPKPKDLWNIIDPKYSLPSNAIVFADFSDAKKESAL